MHDLYDDLIHPRTPPRHLDFDDFTDPPEDTIDAPDDSLDDLDEIVEDILNSQ